MKIGEKKEKFKFYDSNILVTEFPKNVSNYSLIK